MTPERRPGLRGAAWRTLALMKFLDEAKIYLQSGHGGAGAVSFRREKFIPRGGPDGGDGGRGGSVILRARADVNTLIDFRYKQHFRAQAGGHGMGRGRTGAAGADCVVTVPVGTQVLDEDKEMVLADFAQDGQEMVLLKGGDGGFGNAHYKSATNQAPRRSTPGWPGQEAAVWLRLKLIADVGLIGLPNAGKSTFLAAVSAARPKIADYPFTTLHPNLGMARVGEGALVVADIPGLIKGAHAGRGLGTRFLGHVERTRALLHLVDATQTDPAGAYRVVRAELAAYGAGLTQKPEVVALTKVDALTPGEAQARARAFQDATGTPVHTLSAVSGAGVVEVLFALSALVGAAAGR